MPERSKTISHHTIQCDFEGQKLFGPFVWLGFNYVKSISDYSNIIKYFLVPCLQQILAFKLSSKMTLCIYQQSHVVNYFYTRCFLIFSRRDEMDSRLNPLHSRVAFLYLLKTSENLGFLMFSGGIEKQHWTLQRVNGDYSNQQKP